MKIMFVCGGTAGHINPALSLAAEFKRRNPNCKFLFVGADRVLEKRLIPAAGYELVNIKMSGIRRGFKPSDIIQNTKTVTNTILASRKSAKILKSFKPDAVIGTGGYICFPVLRKAAKMGIPTFIHESNAYPGMAVKMLSSIVDRIFVSFKGMESRYKKPQNVIYTGTPLRAEFYEAADKEEKIFRKQRPLVVSFWGSLGAERMNEMMPEFIKLNVTNNSFDHIHVAGNGLAQIKNRLSDLGITELSPPKIDLREYIDEMHTVMKAADLILCRAGGSTIAELIALGKPAILVPSMYVPDNSQQTNAEQLTKAGGAIMIYEKDCSATLLFETASYLLRDTDGLGEMSSAQRSLSSSNAAKQLVDIVLQFFDKDLR